MQAFQLKDLLEAIGPTASLIFAAWIFLSFLQARYTTANERYRSLLDEFRQHTSQDARRSSLRDQIMEYKRRCEQMRLGRTLESALPSCPSCYRNLVSYCHRRLPACSMRCSCCP